MHIRYGDDPSSVRQLLQMRDGPEDTTQWDPWWRVSCAEGCPGCDEQPGHQRRHAPRVPANESPASPSPWSASAVRKGRTHDRRLIPGVSFPPDASHTTTAPRTAGVASLRPTLGKEEFEPRRLRLHPLYHVLDLDAKVIIGSKVIRATHKPVAVASRASATPPVVAWGCPSPGRGDEAKGADHARHGPEDAEQGGTRDDRVQHGSIRLDPLHLSVRRGLHRYPGHLVLRGEPRRQDPHHRMGGRVREVRACAISPAATYGRRAVSTSCLRRRCQKTPVQ